ncbi:MAG: hypothetical protein KGJ57_17575 [Sphingomonadales bacterium]|nr:hypothetical protein [Sphingomonadales bacterium]MDE2171209.1 hypothetical protein [Sphingomonadales bacterium]
MHDDEISTRNAKQFSIDRQADLFRLAKRDHGLSIGVLHQRTRIPTSTLEDWRRGAVMPAWALFALGSEGGVPDELLSLLAEPFNRMVISAEPDDSGEVDDLVGICAEVVAAGTRARHPRGPGGTVIVPQERAEIIDIVRRLRPAANRVIEG